VRGACGERVRERGGVCQERKRVRCLFLSQCTCSLCDAEIGSATKLHASYKRRKDDEER